MVRLRGATVVGPGGLVPDAALVIAGDTIAEITADTGPSAHDIACDGGWIVPGFVDVHVHGALGVDVLASSLAVRQVAQALPRFGVTSFLPTSVACSPGVLGIFLAAVFSERYERSAGAARVLGAHLESNFINPDYRGAQPARCLRLPPRPGDAERANGDYSGADILHLIEAASTNVRIVTLAPELPGALDLVTRLVAAGPRVSLGHSGASFDRGMAAVKAGARHATHLFNRMPPLSHRAPGLAGAMLAAPEVVCELVVDGVHVHPAMVAWTVRVKGVGGVAAITDGTAGVGLPVGATAVLGEQVLHVRADRAELADGTLAGSVTTMDAVFRRLVGDVGLTVSEAVHVTSTTPAAAAGRPDLGRLAVGHPADLVVLDAGFQVRQTWVAGECVWNSGGGPAVSPAEVRS